MRRAMLLSAAMMAALLLASGVALAVHKIGTTGPDTWRGTNKGDDLLGRGGNDELYALAGDDNVLGGEGKDAVFGGDEDRPFGGEKNLVGGPANDLVCGGKGFDNLVGGEGNDFVCSGDPRAVLRKDHLCGGEGNDALTLGSGPASEAIVVCGGGFDRVFADRKDVVAPDCEKVFIGERNFDAFLESIPQSFWDGLPQF